MTALESFDDDHDPELDEFDLDEFDGLDDDFDGDAELILLEDYTAEAEADPDDDPGAAGLPVDDPEPGPTTPPPLTEIPAADATVVIGGANGSVLFPPDTDATGEIVIDPGTLDEEDGDGSTYTMVDGLIVDDEDLAPPVPIHERPLLPDRAVIVTSALDASRRQARTAAFHIIRSPKYGSRLAIRFPYGIKRIVGGLRHWASDPDYAEALEVAKITQSGNVDKLQEAHKETVKARRSALAALAIFAVIVLALVWIALPLWQFILQAVLGLMVLGFVGRPLVDAPIVERVRFNKSTSPPFTESLLLDALRVCGAEPKGRRAIQVIQPPIKIRTGWEAIVKVGVSAETIIKQRETFAAELDRPTNCVWLTRDPEDAAGDLRIVVTRKSLRSTKMPEWPFRHGGRFDHFTDEVPVGVDETGNPVAANRSAKSTVYGGIMGAGKTVSMIISILGQAIDPRVELHFYDLKGGTDWLDFTPIAHFLRSGTDAEDEEAILADLRDLNKRMDARFKQLHRVGEEAGKSVPKTNTALADRRDLDLHPIVIVIDETQEMFEFSPNAKEYLALISRLMKKGRAVAITIEGGSQEVKKETVPFAPLCLLRHCLAVNGHGPNDLVLGTGAYGAGFRANDLTAEDRGIGFFGSGKEITLVRSYFLDPDEGEIADVVDRLRAEREAANRLTGMAAGEIEPDDDYRTIVDDLADYWPGDAAKMSHVLLARHLATVLPDKHADLDKDKLSSRGRSHGLTSVDNCKGPDGKHTLKGFAYADVLAHRSESAE